jgi:phage terminase large subunit-like protein
MSNPTRPVDGSPPQLERTNKTRRRKRSKTDRKLAANRARSRAVKATFEKKKQQEQSTALLNPAEIAATPPRNKGGRPRSDPKLLAARRSYDNKKQAPSAAPVLAVQPLQTSATAPSTQQSAPGALKDYSALAEQYALDVDSGKIIANKWVRLAAKRHLNDLQRQREPDYPYYFDAKEANEKAALIEQFPHIKGRWAAKKQLLELQPWQCFLVCVGLGWRRRFGEHANKRRFREFYWRIPRKNAKSTLAAAIGNALLVADGEFGAEVYSGATSEKQAWEVFGPAQLMFERSPKLLNKYGVEVRARALVRTEDASRFWPLIGKPGDGASPSCAIIDEYHEHATSDLVDTMVTGMGAREQPLLLIITTAGVSLSSPCYDKDQEAQKVLMDVFQNEELFCVMWGIDEMEGKEGEPGFVAGDDWADPKSLEKANPNLGISVDRDILLARQREAIQNPTYQVRFKTKHLNVWCNASVAGINMHLWKIAADKALSLEEFVGQECWGSLDLASKSDICDYGRLFTRSINGQLHYYVFNKHYLPERAIEADDQRSNRDAYRRWVAQKWLVPTEGAEIDFDLIKEQVKGDAERFQFKEIVYDPWRATQLAHQLRNDGATVVELQQSPKNLGAAFDELNTALKAGRFHHDGDPVLEWMASNVIARTVMKGLTVPGKDKPENKIDGIVAIVMAISRAMLVEPSGQDEFFRNPVTA